MVRPAQRRIVVAWAESSYRVSQCRACRLLAVNRSTIRYRSRKPSQEPLRRRMREMAGARVHAGYRQLHVYLRREGWLINHKRLYRLYIEEGLGLRRKRPRRRRSAARRVEQPRPEMPNEIWAMDFMHDSLADGGRLRVLTVVDTYTRECVALEAAQSFHGGDVAKISASAGRTRGGLPKQIRVDNGTEFTSKALDAWAYWNHVELVFSRPGKPVDNAFAESFNATVRRECLSQHWFREVKNAQEILERWRDDYNNERLHSSLGLKTPAQYRAGLLEATDRSEAPKVAELPG
jgi:putative transposase